MISVLSAFANEGIFRDFRLLSSFPKDYEELKTGRCDEVSWEFVNRYLIQRPDRYFKDDYFRCLILGRVHVGESEYLIYKVISRNGYDRCDTNKIDVFICSINDYKVYPKTLKIYSAFS